MIEVAKIKSLAKRINALMDERDGILADIRDIYAEAKSHDIVPKVLRKVIARQRAKDPAALILEDDLLDTYLAALDGPTRRAVEMAASGATAREIEAETGIDHVTVSRSVSLKKDRETNSQTADLDTLPGDGEASADERDASASSPPTRAEIAPVEIFAESANNESCGESHADLQALSAVAAAGSVSPRQAGVERRTDIGVQAMHTSAPERSPHGGAEALSERGEGSGARPGEGRGEVGPTNEARSLPAMPEADSAPTARRAPSRLHEASGSDVAVQSVPRLRGSDMEGCSVAAERACGSTEGRTQPAMRGADSSAVETGGATLAVSPQAGIKPGPQDLSEEAGRLGLAGVVRDLEARHAPVAEPDITLPDFLRRAPATVQP